MGATELFDCLLLAGAALTVADGKLVVHAPALVMETYRPSIKSHREELVDIVLDRQEEARYWFEERAAVAEFSGMLTRFESEVLANNEIRLRYRMEFKVC